MVSYSPRDLSIFPATPAQALESRTRSAVEWKRERSVEQFVERDIIMDNHEHAMHGRLTTWVLAPRHDPTTLDFMCSCETFRRDSIAVRKQVTDAAMKVEDVLGYGIASVFTPESKRRRGYARHMMRLLHWVLAPRSSLPDFPSQWGAPPTPSPSTGNAQFSVLYSDVGPAFYLGCGPTGFPGTGWSLSGAVHTVWPVDAEGQPVPHPDMWKWLSKENVRKIYDVDAQFIRQHVAENASTGISFTFLPDKGVGIFNIDRTMLFPENSLVPELPTNYWGISLADRKDVYATWTLDVRIRSTALVVTRLRVKPTDFAVLLGKIHEAARTVGASTVEIWNLAEDLKEADTLGGITEVRGDHLPAFKWYGKESIGEVHWLYNEKYTTLAIKREPELTITQVLLVLM